MRYRPIKLKYEHIVFALLIFKNAYNEEMKVNVSEFINYKSLILQRMKEMNERITLDVGPKVRREFENMYSDIIDTVYDYSDGLVYVIKSENYINIIKNILEVDLSESSIYSVLCDENLFIASTNKELLKSLRKRKNKF